MKFNREKNQILIIEGGILMIGIEIHTIVEIDRGNQDQEIEGMVVLIHHQVQAELHPLIQSTSRNLKRFLRGTKGIEDQAVQILDHHRVLPPPLLSNVKKRDIKLIFLKSSLKKLRILYRVDR